MAKKNLSPSSVVKGNEKMGKEVIDSKTQKGRTELASQVAGCLVLQGAEITQIGETFNIIFNNKLFTYTPSSESATSLNALADALHKNGVEGADNKVECVGVTTVQEDAIKNINGVYNATLDMLKEENDRTRSPIEAIVKLQKAQKKAGVKNTDKYPEADFIAETLGCVGDIAGMEQLPSDERIK